MRVVLDTSVVVAAIRSEAGASRRLVVGALERRFVMLASVPLMIEYEAVMSRTEHLVASGLDEADVGVLLDALATIVEPVRLEFMWRPVSSDPNDDMVIETAVNGGAEGIVTFNLRHLEAAAGQFGIAALAPAEAVKRMRF